MTDKNQINILSRKIDPSEEDNSKKRLEKEQKPNLYNYQYLEKKEKI